MRRLATRTGREARPARPRARRESRHRTGRLPETAVTLLLKGEHEWKSAHTRPRARQMLAHGHARSQSPRYGPEGLAPDHPRAAVCRTRRRLPAPAPTHCATAPHACIGHAAPRAPRSRSRPPRPSRSLRAPYAAARPSAAHPRPVQAGCAARADQDLVVKELRPRRPGAERVTGEGERGGMGNYACARPWGPG